MRRLVRWLVVLTLALGLGSASAAAREEILRFESDVVVDTAGTLTVTETITVRAEGRVIRRGIFRDFPTVKRDERGFVRTQSFDVVKVERNGAEEPWHTESIKGGTRLYIGDKDVFLSSGVYTYRLTYRSKRQIGFLSDRDEIYWNVTGNFWVFDIQKAIARVTLPEGAEIGDVALYTGFVGMTGKNARVVSRTNRSVTFETTRMLGPGEGLTVAVGFQKGLISEPWELTRTLRALLDNLGLVVLIVGSAGLIGAYGYTWHRIGRDPDPGIVIPLFAPPRGLSPAAVSYVHFRGLGETVRGVSRAFLAALVSLGVKKRLAMQEFAGTMTISKLATDPPLFLPPGEKSIESTLFGGSDQVVVDKSNAILMRSTVSSFARALEAEYGGKYFNAHLGWTFLYFVLSIALFVAFLLLFPATDNQIGLALFSVIGSSVTGTVFVAGMRRLIGDVPGASTLFGVILLVIGGAGLLITAGGPFVVYGLLADHAMETGGTIVTPLILVIVPILALVNAGLAPFLFAPTVEGAKVKTEIEGFKLYLSVAESERLNMRGRPDFTIDLFERYLPYAIALGVEKPWSQALDAHLASALPHDEEREPYEPPFYSGSGWSSGAAFGAGSMASTLGSSFASAMPSQSSGSSGGGSSGGGGGGGGGGGW